MNPEEIIRRTIDFCAEIATNGISTETRLYGKEAIEKLKENYDATCTYILDHINDPDQSE